MTHTCDTSVLLPAITLWHEAHAEAREALERTGVGMLPAHVLIECYSVLTRLPRGQRVRPSDAGTAISALDVETVGLTGDETRDAIARFARHGIAGGAAYDGLVGMTAQRHGLTLLTRDVRARRTYDALGIEYEIV